MIARRTTWLVLFLALASGPMPLFSQLSNSPHDLGAHASGWDSAQCEVCHVLVTGSGQASVWMSELPSPSSYTVYGSGAARSSTLDAWIGQPDGSWVEGAEAAGILHYDRTRGAALADLNLDGKNEVIGIPNVELEIPYVTQSYAIMVLEGAHGDGSRSAMRSALT